MGNLLLARRRGRAPWRPFVAVAIVLTLAASLTLAVTGSLGPGQRRTGGPAALASVPGGRIDATPRGVDPEAADARTAPDPRWPAAGTAVVTLAGDGSLRRAGDLPLRVGTTTSPGTSVRVEVLDRTAASAAGLTGVVFRLGPAARSPMPRETVVEFDYDTFRAAFGGDFASRLSLVAIPDCPQSTSCVPRPVRAVNNPNHHTVTASLTTGTYALTAGSSGPSGSYRATSLAPSATWQVGLQSGDFGWAYPIGVPTVPGLEPKIALTYSSGSVDGRTASTNNQPSWLGEGFDYQPGYIERGYRDCADDGQSGVDELCWASGNATVFMPGLADQLVRDDATGTWRTEDDDGWRVEPLTGADNGDDDGEYWRLTSPAGTQFYFGRDKLPGWSAGAPVTGSTWTVPVYGNQSGEPCHAATFAASSCPQAYRWNLDYIVDTHNDAMAYYYSTEANYYAAASGTIRPYVRAGYVARIEYGLRAPTVYTTPAAARVVFATGDRCLSGSACQASQPTGWPDVPWDRQCSATTCAIGVPTFWGTKRLAGITTQVYTGGSYVDVDTWTLAHTFPEPHDGTSAALWLNSIVHTGLAGGSASLPPVTFDGIDLENRVLGVSGDLPMVKHRLRNVYTETGGQIQVTYAPEECAAGSLPAPDSNTLRCYPAYSTLEGSSTPTLDWFHKYVVTRVDELDLVGGSPTHTVEYEFVGGGAWHHDDSELLPAGRQSWGQWRGFQRVRVRTGPPGGAQTLVEHVLLRGMDGDLLANGSHRDVWVTNSTGSIEDAGPLQGFGRESTTFDGVGGAWLSRIVSEPTDPTVTATRVRPGEALRAYQTGERRVTTSTALAAGGVRTTEVRYGYDGYGSLSYVDDRGDTTSTADDQCTRLTYTRNTSAWIVNSVSRHETVAVNCDGTASYPADLLSDERVYYDGSTVWASAPTVGDVTSADKATAWVAGAPVYSNVGRVVRDAHGRVVEGYDALGNHGTITYTPGTGGPVTSVTQANALGHTMTTAIDPLLATTTSSVDANGRRTDLTYDPLGRLTAVWLPGQSRSAGANPNLRFSYVVSTAVPGALVTQRLLGTGTSYVTTYQIYDGLVRERQSQAPAPGGGRIVADRAYDEYGRVSRTSSAFYNSDPPSASLMSVTDSAVPSQTRVFFDGAGRPTATALYSAGSELWRSTVSYGGDRVSADPPLGGTATTSIVDARNQVTELRQYLAGAPTGSYDSTRYTYTKAGQLATVTDPAGNVWSYTYDLKGRRTAVTDPDAGTTTYTYDAADQVSTVTTANGTLAYTYDVLHRKTGEYAGSPSGVKRAEWVYDTLPGGRGLSTKATRWTDGNAYVEEVLGYDAAGRVTGAATTIPANETGLAGRYETNYTYNAAGQLTTAVLPAMGDLPPETLRYGYDGTAGLPTTLVGSTGYVTASAYTKLGEPERITLGLTGKQVYLTFGYDSATRRVTQLKTTAQSTVVADLGYTYDPAGNVTRIANTPAGQPADVQCFGQDHLRRLNEAWTPASGDCAAAPTVGGLGGPAPYWQSYTYDTTGNRLTETWHASGGDTQRTYAYPPAGNPQPHALTSVTTTGPGAGTQTFGYDALGNTVSVASGGTSRTLSWDVTGRLQSVTQGGATTSYVYDAAGSRVVRHDPTGSTLYLSGGELRRDAATGSLTGTRYYSHLGQAVAIRTAGKVTWLGSDLHGTASTAVDASTLVVSRRRETPFGGARGPAVSWPGERGFVGGTSDSSTGYVHLGAREYDQSTGRFLSVDPLADTASPQQLHGYAYANNNPASFADPDGLAMKPITQGTATMNSVSQNSSPSVTRLTTVKNEKLTYEFVQQIQGQAAVDNALDAFDRALSRAAAELKSAQKRVRDELARIDKLPAAKQKAAVKTLADWFAAQVHAIGQELSTALTAVNRVLVANGLRPYDYAVVEVGFIPKKTDVVLLEQQFEVYVKAAEHRGWTNCGCTRLASVKKETLEAQVVSRFNLEHGSAELSYGMSVSITATRTGNVYFGISAVAGYEVSGPGADTRFSISVRTGRLDVWDRPSSNALVRVRPATDAELDDWVPGWGYAVSLGSGPVAHSIAGSIAVGGSGFLGTETGHQSPPGGISYSVSIGYVWQIQ